MTLSLREKENFYRSLGQLLRAGATFPKALESLSRTMRGARRSLVAALRKKVEQQTVAEAFTSQRPAVSEMEVGTIAAAERTGQLERGCTQLAEYFASLAKARETMLRKSAYPIFVLHFGILVLALPAALSGGGIHGYLRHTLTIFAAVWGGALLLAVLVPLLRDLGATSGVVDALLRSLPLVGKVRRSFAVARFTGTYEMQLDAGVNVMDALQAAGRASRSGLIRGTVRRAVPEVRGGAQVGPMLARGGAFPEAMVSAICVAEESGELDRELKRLAAEYQAEALQRLETVADWLPKLLYLAICIYTGYGIVRFYAGYLKQVQDITDMIH